MGIVSTVTALIVTPTAVMLDEYLIDLSSWLADLPPEISNGLVPFVLVFAGVTGFYVVMKRKFEATRAEAVQTLFVFLLVAFVMLTVIGIWFRGEGMALKLLGS